MNDPQNEESDTGYGAESESGHRVPFYNAHLPFITAIEAFRSFHKIQGHQVIISASLEAFLN